MEGTNSHLLGQLHHLCSPRLGEDNYKHTSPDHITQAWPNLFDTAICQLNEHIIPAFHLSPKELLLGLVINTAAMPIPDSTMELTPDMVSIQAAYSTSTNSSWMAQVALRCMQHNKKLSLIIVSNDPEWGT